MSGFFTLPHDLPRELPREGPGEPDDVLWLLAQIAPPARVAGFGDRLTVRQGDMAAAGWQVINTRVIVGAAWAACYAPMAARIDTLQVAATGELVKVLADGGARLPCGDRRAIRLPPCSNWWCRDES